MKFAFRIAAAVAATVLSLSALSASARDTGGTITFCTRFTNFVGNGKRDEWTGAFEKAYPGTEVEIVPVAGYRRDMPTRMASRDCGDVLDNLPPKTTRRSTPR